MTMITAAFGPAKVRTQNILYRCDLSSDKGIIIPLGVLSDITTGGIWGLGLVARKSLTEAETNAVGRLMRDEVKLPFKFLSAIFEEIFDARAASKAFEDLPRKHSHSLLFASIEEASIEVPKPLVTNNEARELWAKDALSSHCNTAFWTLFGDHLPDAIDKGIKEDTREAA
jgi:hypothetical protein